MQPVHPALHRLMEKPVISWPSSNALASEQKIDFNKERGAAGWKHNIEPGHVDACLKTEGPGHTSTFCLLFWHQVVIYASALSHIVVE